MAKTDPRDFLLNTDYEMDKIIYFKEVKLTPNQYGVATVTHNLGIAPLVTGVWSKNDSFNEPHALSGTSGVIDPSTSSYVMETIICHSDETKITFTQYAGPVSSPTNFTFYVRIMCFEPYGSHKNLPHTSKNANKFILNTDYNYLKLWEAGAKDTTYDPNLGQLAPVTIEHNLGYHAQGLFWIESFGQNYHETIPITAWIIPNIFTDKAGVESFTNKFIIYPPLVSGSTHKIQYRIYYDEAV